MMIDEGDHLDNYLTLLHI